MRCSTAWVAVVVGLSSLCLVVTQVPNVDPTPFLQDQAFVRRQLACVGGYGRCDFIGRYIQGAVSEVLTRGCRNCTPQQADNARRILNFIRTNYPNDYARIYQRYYQPAPANSTG